MRSVRSGESTSTSTARTILQILRSAKQATRLKQIYLWAYRIVSYIQTADLENPRIIDQNQTLPCALCPVGSYQFLHYLLNLLRRCCTLHMTSTLLLSCLIFLSNFHNLNLIQLTTYNNNLCTINMSSTLYVTLLVISDH